MVLINRGKRAKWKNMRTWGEWTGGGVIFRTKKLKFRKQVGGVSKYGGKNVKNWKKFAGWAEKLLRKFFQVMFRKFSPDPPSHSEEKLGLYLENEEKLKNHFLPM